MYCRNVDMKLDTYKLIGLKIVEEMHGANRGSSAKLNTISTKTHCTTFPLIEEIQWSSFTQKHLKMRPQAKCLTPNC